MGFLIIILYPFAEIYAYYKFIEAYSFLDAILFAFISGGLGSLIMTLQGKETLALLQISMIKGELPAKKILHRALVFMGGLLIFLPGIVSDITGLMLILPGTRHLILWMLQRTFVARLARGGMGVFMGSVGGANGFGFTSAFKHSFESTNPNGENPFESKSQVRDVIEVTPIQIQNKKQD